MDYQRANRLYQVRNVIVWLASASALIIALDGLVGLNWSDALIVVLESHVVVSAVAAFVLSRYFRNYLSPESPTPEQVLTEGPEYLSSLEPGRFASPHRGAIAALIRFSGTLIALVLLVTAGRQLWAVADRWELDSYYRMTGLLTVFGPGYLLLVSVARGWRRPSGEHLVLLALLVFNIPMNYLDTFGQANAIYLASGVSGAIVGMVVRHHPHRTVGTRLLMLFGGGVAVAGFCDWVRLSTEVLAPSFGLVIAWLVHVLAHRVASGLSTPDGRNWIDGTRGREYVVYLRAFRTDDEALWGAVDYEAELMSALAPYGQVVAVGRPKEVIRPPGAFRVYIGHDDWETVVQQLSKGANLVVLRPDSTKGIEIEVQIVVEHLDPQRVLIYCPPDEGAKSDEMYQSFRRTLGKYFPRELPKKRQGNLIAFDSSWNAFWLTWKPQTALERAYRFVVDTVSDDRAVVYHHELQAIRGREYPRVDAAAVCRQESLYRAKLVAQFIVSLAVAAWAAQL